MAEEPQNSDTKDAGIPDSRNNDNELDFRTSDLYEDNVSDVYSFNPLLEQHGLIANLVRDGAASHLSEGVQAVVGPTEEDIERKRRRDSDTMQLVMASVTAAYAAWQGKIDNFNQTLEDHQHYVDFFESKNILMQGYSIQFGPNPEDAFTCSLPVHKDEQGNYYGVFTENGVTKRIDFNKDEIEEKLQGKKTYEQGLAENPLMRQIYRQNEIGLTVSSKQAIKDVKEAMVAMKNAEDADNASGQNTQLPQVTEMKINRDGTVIKGALRQEADGNYKIIDPASMQVITVTKEQVEAAQKNSSVQAPIVTWEDILKNYPEIKKIYDDARQDPDLKRNANPAPVIIPGLNSRSAANESDGSGIISALNPTNDFNKVAPGIVQEVAPTPVPDVFQPQNRPAAPGFGTAP